MYVYVWLFTIHHFWWMVYKLDVFQPETVVDRLSRHEVEPMSSLILFLALHCNTITVLHLPTRSPSCHRWLSLCTEPKPALCHWVIPRHWFLSDLSGTKIKGRLLGSAHRRQVSSSWAHAIRGSNGNATTPPLAKLTRYVMLWLRLHTKQATQASRLQGRYELI